MVEVFNNLLLYVQKVLIVLLIVNIVGYILVVFKEKSHLKNNMIVIENKSVTQKDLDKADMKEFIINGERVKSGDEVKVVTTSKDKFKGTLIGIIRQEKSILMVTYTNEVKKLNIEKITKFKIISKYGKFFN